MLLHYYRDDRVKRSLGQDPRLPFPKGYVVEQGDCSARQEVGAAMAAAEQAESTARTFGGARHRSG